MNMKPVSAPNKKRGPDRSETRKAAEAAGISRGQMYRMLDIASIPKDQFEDLIEGDNPPTMTELVRIARSKEAQPVPRRLGVCPHCGGDLRRGA